MTIQTSSALGLLCVLTTLWAVAGCGSNEKSGPAPVSAAQLQANFTAQVEKGNDAAALVIARTLTQRYPESTEAAAVKAQLPEVKARAEVQRARERAELEAQRAKEKAVAEKLARETRIKNEAQFKKLLARMKSKHDPVEHVTFFQPLTNPARAGAESYAMLYVGLADSGDVWLRTRLQYGGDDWIFFDVIKFSIDGTTLPAQKLGYFQVQRDNADREVWEWIDLAVSDDALPIFDRLANGEVSLIRFEGKYRKDLTLSARAKQALRDSLELYGLLKAGMRP